MKTVLVCFILLHPHMGEGQNTTVVRVNKKTPERCHAALHDPRARKSNMACSCEKKGVWPKPPKEFKR